MQFVFKILAFYTIDLIIQNIEQFLISLSILLYEKKIALTLEIYNVTSLGTIQFRNKTKTKKLLTIIITVQ